MLNPNTPYSDSRSPITLGSSYILDAAERDRLEKLAITPEHQVKNKEHLQQIEAAKQRVFGGNWPEERLEKLFEIISQQETVQPIPGKIHIWHDWSSQTKQQSGDMCGYHAVYNLGAMLSSLEKRSERALSALLQEGPPLREWQDFVVAAGGRRSNLNDEDIKLLCNKANISPDKVTIIPNLRDWSPSLDADFVKIADQLQHVNNTVHGFLINTGGHASTMTPAIHQQIIESLKHQPRLQQLFINNPKPHLSAYDEDRIVQELYIQGKGPLIPAVTSLHKTTSHGGFGGHWTATVMQNNNGSLEAHITDSAYNPETKEFGNMETVQKLAEWVTTNPQVLYALTVIPHQLETAKMVMEVNGDIRGALNRLKDVNALVEKTAGLKENHHYRELVLPEIENVTSLLKSYDTFSQRGPP